MVISAFHGERLRLARVALGLTLDQLGARVSATRQYLNQLEQGLKVPTDEMRAALAAALGIAEHFFAIPASAGVSPEECHFPKQRTTPPSVVNQVPARGTPPGGFLSRPDHQLDLPPVAFPAIALPVLNWLGQFPRPIMRVSIGGSEPVRSRA